MTLYRVGRNSPIVEALLEAMENGKQVAVLLELKARFDEESNIEWAQQAGARRRPCGVWLLGLKVHARSLMVVRREGEAIRRYVHLATGNYNPHDRAHLYRYRNVYLRRRDRRRRRRPVQSPDWIFGQEILPQAAGRAA